jgi:hypothetical protein
MPPVISTSGGAHGAWFLATTPVCETSFDSSGERPAACASPVPAASPLTAACPAGSAGAMGTRTRCPFDGELWGFHNR